MSERTPNSPPPTSPSTVGPTAPKASPRLRLAGTNAGPITDEERGLLALRGEVIRARSVHASEAGLIRDRLGRAGRRDPIGHIRGADAFASQAAELEELLAAIDARLASIDAGRPRVEVEPGVTDLLRRS